MFFVKCTQNELAELQSISHSTFKATFTRDNDEKALAAYLATAFSAEQLGRELAEKASAFYLAYQEQAVVGYIKLNEAPKQTEINDSNALELERIYLRKDRQGLGEGKLLLDFAVAVAKKSKKQYLWLGVWEKNQPALKFYQKHGFYAFSEHDFWLGKERQRDILMRKDLV